MKSCLAQREDTSYLYQGKKVIILTVFKGSEQEIAIIEDELGSQYEVLKEELRKV